MAEPDRSRIPLLLGVIGFFVICFVFPRVFFAFRLGMMEMRYFSWFIILGGLFIWVLIKLGRKKDR